MHSPSTRAFACFDDLLLLAPGGRAVYCGPLSDAPAHFTAVGYPMPPDANPAEFYMDVGGCACLCVRVCACVCVCARVCVCACVCVCARTRVCVFAVVSEVACKHPRALVRAVSGRIASASDGLSGVAAVTALCAAWVAKESGVVVAAGASAAGGAAAVPGGAVVPAGPGDVLVSRSRSSASEWLSREVLKPVRIWGIEWGAWLRDLWVDITACSAGGGIGAHRGFWYCLLRAGKQATAQPYEGARAAAAAPARVRCDAPPAPAPAVFLETLLHVAAGLFLAIAAQNLDVRRVACGRALVARVHAACCCFHGHEARSGCLRRARACFPPGAHVCGRTRCAGGESRAHVCVRVRARPPRSLRGLYLPSFVRAPHSRCRGRACALCWTSPPPCGCASWNALPPVTCQAAPE